jgi:hypothetical protein
LSYAIRWRCWLHEPQQQIEASVSHRFMRKTRAGVPMPDLDLFGEQVVRRKGLAAPVGPACRCASW